MIINQNTNKDLNLATLQDVIDMLNTYPNRFFITGSQFFGNSNKNSDYDFFTDHTCELEKLLLTAGFKVLESTFTNYEEADENKQLVVNNVYNSEDIAKVLEYICPQDGAIIQMQLLQSGMTEIKNDIQNYLFNHRIGIDRMDKTSRKILWNIMFDMYLSESGDGYKFRNKQSLWQKKVDIKKPEVISLSKPKSSFGNMQDREQVY